jgi:AraC-like DNA-binding protein/ligand-binding sensor protein
LAESRLFRTFQQAFEVATGRSLTLRAVESEPVAVLENDTSSLFCSLLAQTHLACALCRQRRQGGEAEPGSSVCVFGLCATAIGVKIGKEIVAYLQTGQVLFRAPTKEQTRRAHEQIREWGLGSDADQAVRNYQATPVVHRREYQAGVKLLQIFALQLGAAANQIVMLQADAEPAPITRARELIAAQYQKAVPLAVIAKQVGMNKYHFCKRFKQATGIHYTDYVARLRIEKAKNLLLNPNFRISELAFEVGFQSLTHFNRAFRRIAGESPTEYREHLKES